MRSAIDPSCFRPPWLILSRIEDCRKPVTAKPRKLSIWPRRISKEISLESPAEVLMSEKVVAKLDPIFEPKSVALIGASNHFEVAIATSTMLFGLSSGAALATVVGVLIEVPVMLLLVRVCLRTERWFPAQREA